LPGNPRALLEEDGASDSGNSASFHTTNTIPNALAKFDVAPLIAEALIASAEMS
jgi:hypothetical protein